MRPTLLAATTLMLAVAAAAQAPAPDPHWGADAFPRRDDWLRAGLSFSRFTEYSYEGQRYPSDVDESTGFNQLVLSRNDVPSWCSFASYRVQAGIGFSNDQPTRFLQNDFLHPLLNIDEVRVEDTRSEFELTAGGDLTFWSPEWAVFGGSDAAPLARDGIELFGGGGAALGTIYNEAFVHAGALYRTPEITPWLFGWHHGVFELGVLGRGNATRPGDAYRRVSEFSFVGQTSIAWEPTRPQDETWLGNPSLAVILTWDSGLFLDANDGDPLDTSFVSFRAEWPGGMIFETWNDMYNGTDFGPSYGFQISWDLLALTRSWGWTP